MRYGYNTSHARSARGSLGFGCWIVGACPFGDGCRKPSPVCRQVLALRAFILMPYDPSGLRAPLAGSPESHPIKGWGKSEQHAYQYHFLSQHYGVKCSAHKENICTLSCPTDVIEYAKNILKSLNTNDFFRQVVRFSPLTDFRKSTSLLSTPRRKADMPFSDFFHPECDPVERHDAPV